MTDDQIEDALAAAGVDFYSTGTIAGTASDLFAGVRNLVQASRRTALEEGPLRGYVRGLASRNWQSGTLTLDAEDWCAINHLLNDANAEGAKKSP